MIQDVSFYVISVLAVLLLSALVPLALKKYFIIPILTLAVMLLAAFVIPNFIDTTNWESLAGYAVFLGILSLLVSILMWFYLRGRKKKKELSKQNDPSYETNEDEKLVKRGNRKR